MKNNLDAARNKFELYEFVSFLFFCLIAIIWYVSIPCWLIGEKTPGLQCAYIACMILLLLTTSKKKKYSRMVKQFEEEIRILNNLGSYI